MHSLLVNLPFLKILVPESPLHRPLQPSDQGKLPSVTAPSQVLVRPLGYQQLWTVVNLALRQISEELLLWGRQGSTAGRYGHTRIAA